MEMQYVLSCASVALSATGLYAMNYEQ